MSTSTSNHLLRRGSARWTGPLAQGEGVLSTGSGVLQDQRYAFSTRFGAERGTNPEELIAAAHAGCYSMALTYLLGQAGTPPRSVETTAELSLRMGPQGPEVMGIALTVQARVDGLDPEAFEATAQQAKRDCLISRLLNTEVTLTAQLLD